MTMTVNEVDTMAGYRFDTVVPPVDYVRFAYDTGIASNEYTSVEVRNVTPRMVRPAKQSKKVLRRIKGFLIEFCGQEAKVGFVDNGVTHEYYLPVKHLTGAGIKAANQPFQMDEVEIKTESGMFVGYEFQPLALPKDAFEDSIALDSERERKRNLIFKAFGNAQG